jgi:serine/threonine protein kinase
MSPEQAEGGDLGPESDVFSFGAVLVLAATGVGPFDDSTPLVLLSRIVADEPGLGSLAEPVRGILAECLRRDRAARPTAIELAERLQPVPEIRRVEWLPPAITALIPPASLASLRKSLPRSPACALAAAATAGEVSRRPGIGW